MSTSTISQKTHPQRAAQAMQFGLMFFTSGETALDQDKYRLVIESAKFADQHGFSSIWVPERHFTAMGCLYPNPAVLQAALARETQRVQLRAGSVVMPLHHPLRIAEDWAMVDNLSGGRVGVSFASGWNPSDFAFFPERYTHRHSEMYRGIRQVQALWRGESISITRGDGDRQEVRIYPTPIQSELPIWITAASNPDTFIKAGQMGAHLLTHLFDQEVEVLAEKIALYRQARLDQGHDPETGQVTVTLHTFVGDHLASVQEQVRSPYCDYLKANANLLAGLGHSRGIQVSVETLSPADLDSVTNLIFEKFFHDRRALLGTSESCVGLVEQLRQIGVNEIACLLDFGPDIELILDNLPHLDRLRRACAAVADDRSIAQPPLALIKSPSQPISLPVKQPPEAPMSDGPALAGGWDEIQRRCRQVVTGADFYQRLQAQGVELGISFRGIVQLWRGEREALGKICLPASLVSEVTGYGVHPALLDACLQVFFATIPTGQPQTDPSAVSRSHYLPARLGNLQLGDGSVDPALWSHAVLRSEAAVGVSAYLGDVRIFTATGQEVMRITGLRLQQAQQRDRAADLKDWFYRVKWRPQPAQAGQSPAPNYLPSPLDIAEQVRHQMSQQNGWAPLSVYRSLFPKLEALGTAYVLWAFQQMGIALSPGQRLSVTAITQQVQGVRAYQRLLKRLIQILQQAGVCQAIAADEWEIGQTGAIRDPQPIWRSLRAEYPQCSAELELLGRCGQHLAAVLQGQTDPLQLLFPEGSVAAVERLYQDSPGSQVANHLVEQAVATALAQLPANRPIRILEIGAGTGGTTASVLPQLPADRSEYHFTDVSYLFMAKAEQKFQTYPFVQYRVLDIEQDPQAQGFLSQHYDLILAANVLHATADLTQTLTHVKQLLAPGGLLVLLEGVQPQVWVDLIFGLTEGWWKFTDSALRSDSALLSAPQWRKLLHTLDFDPAEVITAEAEALAQQAVILAAGPRQTGPKPAGPVPVSSSGNNSVNSSAQGAFKSAPERWLIFADDAGVGHQLAAQLQTQGDRCVLVVPGEAYQVVETDRIQLNPNQPDDFRRLFQSLAARHPGPWQGLVYLWGLNASAVQMTAVELASACDWTAQSPLYLLQALDSVADFPTVPLWWVTQGGQQIESADEPLAVAQSLLWGLGRVVAVEQPQRWGGLVDLDPHRSQIAPSAQAAELLSVIQSGEADQLAFRQGHCYAAQLTPDSAQLAQSLPYRWQAHASYLITGGLGDLGLLVADWMAAQGARHIVLLGRSPLPPRVEWSAAEPGSLTARRVAAIQAIENQGATVYLAAADVADEGQMTTAIAAIKQQGCPAIQGVFHLAGVPHPLQPLNQLDIATLNQVIKPKVYGSWCLHRLFAETRLDFFVMFSSWAGLLGEVGQQIGGYSMANSFLDALAHHRQALGQSALSINWGDWAEVGMRSRYVQQGYQLLPDSWTLKPEQGLASLNQLLSQPSAQMAVLPVPWPEYFKLFPKAALSAFLRPMAQASGEPSKTEAQTEAQIRFLQQLDSLPLEERVAQLTRHVQTQVALIMGISSPDALDLERGLFEMGMDSLMALELKSALESSLGASIPAVAAFEHPSVVALSAYLSQEILGWQPSPPPAQAISPTSSNTTDDPLAKIAQLSDDEVDRLFTEKTAR